MNLYCIELSKLTKVEITTLVKQYTLPFDSEELYRLKLSGYHKIIINQDTNQLVFYTLNNAKREYRIADSLKALLIDTATIGEITTGKSKRPNALLLRTIRPNRIQDELDRILDKIQNLGVDALTEDELEFLNKYKDYFD